MEEMCNAELSALIEQHGQLQLGPPPTKPTARARFATIAAVSDMVDLIVDHNKSSPSTTTTALHPPSDWWVKLSNIHYLIDTGTVAFCDGIKAIDDLMGAEEFELFQEAVLVCREPCRHNLGNPLDQLVDLYSDAMSATITATLAGLHEEEARERWWSDLLELLDEMLDRAAQRTDDLLFRTILKRCGDGFSRALEAVLIGDTPVHGVHSLSEKQEVLQQCLEDVSNMFHAGGQGLSDHMLDKNMSIHSRLGTLVSNHAHDNMQLMAQVQACSGNTSSDQEAVSRSLALLVLGTRAHDPEVKRFLDAEEQAEREHKRAEEEARSSGKLPVPKLEQLTLLWGTQCKLDDSVEKARALLAAGAKSRRPAESAGFCATLQQEGEAHLLPCLCEYLDGGDPLVVASDIAKANVACAVTAEEKVWRATYVGMLTAIISSTLRPRTGRYIVVKKATVRQDRALSSNQKGQLSCGQVILVKDVQELSDGTVRAAFEDGNGLLWTTATKSDGQVLLQRVPPSELTRDNCVLLKRSLLSSRMVGKRQRTLSRAISVGTPTDAASTPRSVGSNSSSVLATMIDIDPPVAVVWYFSVLDHTVQTPAIAVAPGVEFLSKNHPTVAVNSAVEPRNGLSLQEAVAWCRSLPDCKGMWYYDNGRCCPKASWDDDTFTKVIAGGAFYRLEMWSPFNFTECQKIERAFQAKAKAVPLADGTAKFGGSGEMKYMLNSVNQGEFDALAWSKLPVLQEGTLDKKGAREKDGFKPRWFQLRGHHLVYFVAENHSGNIKGKINLLNATGVDKSSESNHELQITMSGAGGRTYRLVAKNQDICDVWISALSLAREEALQELEQQTSEQDLGVVPSGTVVDVEELQVDKYGTAHVLCARPWAGWLSLTGLDGTPLLNPVPQEGGPYHSQSAHDLGALRSVVLAIHAMAVHSLSICGVGQFFCWCSASAHLLCGGNYQEWQAWYVGSFGTTVVEWRRCATQSYRRSSNSMASSSSALRQRSPQHVRGLPRLQPFPTWSTS